MPLKRYKFKGKTMKKVIALLSAIALLTMMAGPALTIADSTATTGLTKALGGGSNPIIKAKWEMKNLVGGVAGVGETGADDSTAANAQFSAPMVWGQNMQYTVCAIATDPNSVDDILGVYAEIFHPTGKAYSEDPAHPDILGNPDYEYPGDGACGAFIEQNTLIKLTKTQGYELFCNQVKNNNNNLPTFSTGYDYNEICATDGELMKETAFVYCDDKTIKWEDPAGLYKVVTYAQDKAGNFSNYLENHYDYLSFTGFEKDFTNVSYGDVLLNTHKKISGDITWGNSVPTVRNTGNTRLNMKVAQDDMGLGQSSGIWNVSFDARVGSDEADWKDYDPFGYKGPSVTPTAGQYVELEDILELSETEEMDFSVLVKKWLNDPSYSGNMWLTAEMANFRTCK